MRKKENCGKLRDSTTKDPQNKQKRQAEVSDAAKDQGNRAKLTQVNV